MKILGIDPGYDRIGVAIIEKTIPKETLLFSTCITTNPKDLFADRLVILGKQLEKIISEYKPTVLAIEELYFAKNSTTAMKVAEARGVIEYLSRISGLGIFEYHPNTIKLAITGNGKADKTAINTMLPHLISVNTAKKIDDELDAIAVALTHSAHCR